MAEEHLAELRRQNLEEINGLPLDERLAQLIANGFTEEAKALSEQLSADEEPSEDEGPAPVVDDDVSPAEKPKKKGGRPKKSRK